MSLNKILQIPEYHVYNLLTPFFFVFYVKIDLQFTHLILSLHPQTRWYNIYETIICKTIWPCGATEYLITAQEVTGLNQSGSQTDVGVFMSYQGTPLFLAFFRTVKCFS
jgi:hypothetical protein